VSLYDVLGGREPYPWQERLYLDLMAGDVPEEVSLPTGQRTINCFLDPGPLAGTWIMLTYYLAQALLVVGLIRADLAARRA